MKFTIQQKEVFNNLVLNIFINIINIIKTLFKIILIRKIKKKILRIRLRLGILR